MCRAFLAKVAARLSAALAAASAKHAQAVTESKGLAALQAMEAQLALVTAARAEQPAAKGAEGPLAGELRLDASTLSSHWLRHHSCSVMSETLLL